MRRTTLICYVFFTLFFLPLWGNASPIALGGSHSCALTVAGGVQCWGNNEDGQLGDGNRWTVALTPVTVSGLSSGVQAIGAGDNYTCALTNTGGVKCWGNNEYGQLGNGSTEIGLTPVAVSGLGSEALAIAVNGLHACALTATGEVKCWGRNAFGQLGDGTTVHRNVPVVVNGLGSGVQAITVGGGHSCALMSTGTMMCWGFNYSGQLGDGTSGDINHVRLTPVLVSGLNDGVQAIAAGDIYTCALTNVSGVKCWGYNRQGQLGDGTIIDRLTPVEVSGLSGGVQAITSQGTHSCALMTAGGVRCWGTNYSGELGDGTTARRLASVEVSGLSSGVQALGVNSGYSCALIATGSVKCWGYNGTGQLGDGTYTNRLSLVFVARDGDGDGVLDMDDAFPLHSAEAIDTDHDGIGNNADIDDDDDGIPDAMDPLLSWISLQVNGSYKGSAISDDALVQ